MNDAILDSVLDMSPESAVTSLLVMVQDMRDQLDEVRQEVHGMSRRNRDYGGRMRAILHPSDDDSETAIEAAVTSSVMFGAQFGVAPLLDIRSRLLAQLEAQRLQLAQLEAQRLQLAEFQRQSAERAAAADHRNGVFRPVATRPLEPSRRVSVPENYHSTRSARPMLSDFETLARPTRPAWSSRPSRPAMPAMPMLSDFETLARPARPARPARTPVPVPVPAEVPDDNVPAWLRCPITFELIQDPVFSRVSGRTYSRAAILRWLRGTSLTDPLTNTRCTERDLFDNLAMREELEHFNNSQAQTVCD